MIAQATRPCSRISGAEVGGIDYHPALDPVLNRCEEYRLRPSWVSLRSPRPREMHDRNNLRFIDAHEQNGIAVSAHSYCSHVEAVEWMVAPHLRRKLRLESQRVRSDSVPRRQIFHGHFHILSSRSMWGRLLIRYQTQFSAGQRSVGP